MLENIFKWGRENAESKSAPFSGFVLEVKKPESRIDMKEKDVVNRLAKIAN